MEKINLKAQKRLIIGKKVKELREQGYVPAVIYGKEKKPQNLQIDIKKFKKVFKKAGTSSLINLKIDDKPEVKVLIQDVQFDPVTDKSIHIDFYAIKMDKKITTEIPLKFIGIAPAVEDLEGNFITNFNELEVECLPNDLIHEITVDISTLKTFDDNIKIKDLIIPDTIKILRDSERVVALVTPPRSEEELEAMKEESTAKEEKEEIEKMEAKADTEKAEKEAEKEQESVEENKNKPEKKPEKKDKK